MRRVDHDGRNIVEIARCLPKPSAVAVDATHVYWIPGVTGEAIRAPK